MRKIIVYLSLDEMARLQRSAERNIRDLRDQARYFIVHGLAAELKADDDVTESVQPEGESAPTMGNGEKVERNDS